MRILLAVIVTVLSTVSFASEFSQKSCESYLRNASYTKALETITARMKITRSDFCSLPQLMDIYITDRDFFNLETQKVEPHVWITLHYNEYSCQYFVRNSDWAVTRKNCYNTIY